MAPSARSIFRLAERCPWPSVYHAARWLTLAGKQIDAHDLFVFVVSAARLERGGEFERALVIAPGGEPLVARVDPLLLDGDDWSLLGLGGLFDVFFLEESLAMPFTLEPGSRDPGSKGRQR